MAGKIDLHLEGIGLDIPTAAAPAGNYSPYVVTGNLIFVSGQGPMVDGAVKYQGIVGKNLTLEDGYQAARLCAINLLAQLKAAVEGDLDRVARVVKLTGYVAGTPDFTDQPKVLNGASDLMVTVFGDNGRHARAAVGCPSLPLGFAVEVDGIFSFV